MLLQGWEQFDEPVDRIVSIGAFEHFGKDRWDDFFTMAYRALPDDGVMLLHTITALTLPQMTERGMPLTFSVARFVKFILTDIFPCGQGRLRADAHAVTTTALRPHPRRVVDRIGSASRTGDRDPVRRGLRPLHAVLDRVRQGIPGRLHRRRPVHPRQVAR